MISSPPFVMVRVEVSVTAYPVGATSTPVSDQWA